MTSVGGGTGVVQEHQERLQARVPALRQHLRDRSKLAPFWRRTTPGSAHNKVSLFRFLFPHLRQTARARIAAFRFDTIPYLKHRAQSRIYRFILARQQKRGLVSRLKARTRVIWPRRTREDARRSLKTMSYNGQWNGGAGSSPYNDAYGYEAREPGARRKKFAGYLKAANELRQTYAQSARQNWNSRSNLDYGGSDMPGAFPGATMTNNGDEQLVIFPSYARRHKKKASRRAPSGTIDLDRGEAQDQDFWQQEWDRHEDENAIVDVDVRGWIYAPHQGPPTRKHRLLVGLARQLSGIPAPRPSPGSSNSSSRASSPNRADSHPTRQEEELTRREAEIIVRRGEAEANAAGQGAYSENAQGRSNLSRGSSSQSLRDALDSGDSSTQQPQRQGTWSSAADMTQAELVVANNHLLSRLQPFLANPLCNIAISAFFYNEDMSRQKSVETDTSGHFTLRAALDFVPTHVRILASERLSATEAVLITEPQGVSVIRFVSVCFPVQRRG